MFLVGTLLDKQLCLQGFLNRLFARLLPRLPGRYGNSSGPSRNWLHEVFRALLAAPRFSSDCVSRFWVSVFRVLVASADELYDWGAGKCAGCQEPCAPPAGRPTRLGA